MTARARGSRRPALERTLAVVDLGSNSVRLQVARASEDGTLRVLLEDRESVRLGQNVFRTGRLDTEVIARTAEALRRFAELARRVGADAIRAVATSAVREASNRDALIKAVRARARLEVEVISGAEEARLICLGVLRDSPATERQLLLDIGGGSTELTASRGEEPESSVSLSLGSVRLTEMFVRQDPVGGKEARLLEEAIGDALREVDPRKFGRSPRILASAGSASAAVALGQRLSGEAGPFDPLPRSGRATRAQLELALAALRRSTLKERRRLGVEEHRADIVYAGTAILVGVLRHLRIDQVQLTARGLRDGLMVDLLRREVRPPAAGLHQEAGVLAGLRAFGERCGVRQEHSDQVAALSLSLFDQTKAFHKLGAQERGLLNAAALLHDVGRFVSHNRHHKHAYYLLRHADLPGFTDHERELIALVARYHRKSGPKDHHPEFALLPLDERNTVRVLSGLLRVADGLDRGHARHVRAVRVRRLAGKLLLELSAPGRNADLEIWSARQKIDLLQALVGREVVLRAKGMREPRPRAPQPLAAAPKRSKPSKPPARPR